MKLFASALLLGVMMLVGCGDSQPEPKTPGDALKQAGDAAQDAAQKASEALEDAKNANE